MDNNCKPMVRIELNGGFYTYSHFSVSVFVDLIKKKKLKLKKCEFTSVASSLWTEYV